MKDALCLATAFVLAAPSLAGAAVDADPSLVVLNPDAYVGKAVTIAVKFTRIDTGRESWEEQADLKTRRTIKFAAAPPRENQVLCGPHPAEHRNSRRH